MGDGKFRIGPETDQPDAVMLIGHCQLGSPDAALLVSLLPQLIHVRAEKNAWPRWCNWWAKNHARTAPRVR